MVTARHGPRRPRSHRAPRQPRRATWLSFAALLASLLFAGWAARQQSQPLGSTPLAGAATQPAPTAATLGGPQVNVNAPVNVAPHVSVNVAPPATSRPPAAKTPAPRHPAPAPRTQTRPDGPTAVDPPGACLPPYPGPVYPGERGSRVLEWQRILVAVGLIHGDRPGNLDGYFGPGTRDLVDTLQASWGWAPVPGYLGPRTYRKLTEVYCR